MDVWNFIFVPQKCLAPSELATATVFCCHEVSAWGVLAPFDWIELSWLYACVCQCIRVPLRVDLCVCTRARKHIQATFIHEAYYRWHTFVSDYELFASWLARVIPGGLPRAGNPLRVKIWITWTNRTLRMCRNTWYYSRIKEDKRFAIGRILCEAEERKHECRNTHRVSFAERHQ